MLVGMAPAGCGDDSKELFVRPFDAAADADATDEKLPDVDPTLGGPCTEDSQCDDMLACTFDRCDQTLSRCRNTPDDTQCADDSYCNGRELCVLHVGCTPGPVVTCQDGSPCTIDRCDEPTKACTHADRDLDGDGDPDNHCIGNRDCDDLDPNVSSTHSEVCGNFIDDNCNGEVDEVGCVSAANDVCATALNITAAGTYVLSTVAAKKDYDASCTVTTASAAKDIVVTIKVPGNPGDAAKNITVTANAEVSGNEVAVALQSSCGVASSELSCGHIGKVNSARAIAREAAAGSTIAAIITTQSEGAVDLKVDIADAAPAPTNESCASPLPVTTGTPFTVSLVDPARDLASDCPDAVTPVTGELTYSFTLATPQDVRIFASTVSGAGDPIVSLRDTACATELRCRAGSAVPVFARNLAAGTHVFSVAGTQQLDASVLVKTYPPTAAPPNQSCATAPTIATNTRVLVDLSAQEDAIKNGCYPGSSQAAFDLELTQPSDVLIVGRFPQNEVGAVSLNGAGCTKAEVLACSNKGGTPQRVSKRNLPAGTYRVVISDQLGLTAELNVLVRPTVAPTTVTTADTCLNVFSIADAGGFFTGNTTPAAADFNAGCDAPGQPLGGAHDQILKLDLAAQKRVVFDMTGSGYTTVLDIRSGTCPGVEVPDACYVGFGPNRSFLDLTLPTGTYYVQVDGYSAGQGVWNLDVRTLSP